MKDKKSYFQVFFLNFVLMIIVPLLTIILIFGKADRIVREQVLDYASETLEQYSELFDVTIRDMKSTCLTIFGSKECRNYYNYSMEGTVQKFIESYKINNLLASVNNEKYFDVFVYFPTDDKVISATKATLKSNAYYEVYYSDGKKADGWQEFKEVIHCNSGRPVLFVVNSQDNKPYLCVAMNVAGVFEMDYTICVVLDPEYVKEIYNIRDTDENSAFYIFDGDKKLLMVNNTHMREKDQVNAAILEELESAKWYNEESFMLMTKECDSIEGYYAYSVQTETFWSILSDLRIFSFWGIMLCVFTSIVIAYRNSIRAYRPVGNLLKRVTSENNIEYDKTKGNEFDFLTFFLDENEKKLKENRHIQREWYLLKTLKGKIETKEEEKTLRNMMSFVSDKFVTCILRVDFSQEENEELQDFIVQNVFLELCENTGKGYFISFEKDEYVILVNITGELSGLIEDLQEGQRFCEQYYHIFMTLAYSNIHEDVSNIPMSYKEAQEAMRYQYLLGQGSVIPFAQIRDRKKQKLPGIESGISKLLQKYINGEKEKGAAQFVEELLLIYNIGESSSMDRVDNFKKEVADALNKFIWNGSEDDVNCNDVIEELLEQPTLMGFRTHLCYLLQEIPSMEIGSESEELAVRTKCYIDENYWNSNLSVVMLGEEMGVRGKYLSKVFCEKYHMSLPEYLLYVRMQHAKIYLTEKDMTIQEIAEATGFLSSQVFIRNFKKREGMTPGKFKEFWAGDLNVHL